MIAPEAQTAPPSLATTDNVHAFWADRVSLVLCSILAHLADDLSHTYHIISYPVPYAYARF